MPRWIHLLLAALGACSGPGRVVPEEAEARPRPNLVLIVADDLGWGELGCYGQIRFRTPELDRLARSGVRFTHGYAGAPVCAPSRCAILTGRDSEHLAIRDNAELRGADGRLVEGQAPLPPGTPTLAGALRASGYATALIGKWGLGGPGSGSEPRDHGFERFFGYLCQRAAHDHFPPRLWDGDRSVELAGTFSEDLFVERALAFLAEPRDQPFFLLFAPALPHLALQVPEEDLARWRGAYEEQPYDGSKGYRPHATPRAAYAAMIARLDRDVGRIVARLGELGLARDTLVVFTSDNGPTHDVGGVDTGFFDSTRGLRGRKGSVDEGGLRVPLIASWPGRIAAGGVSARPVVGWDLCATLCDAAGATIPAGEGRSALPEMLAPGSMAAVDRLAWAFPGYGGQVALRLGAWKVVQPGLAHGDGPVRVHDIDADPREERPLGIGALPAGLRGAVEADLARLRALAVASDRPR